MKETVNLQPAIESSKDIIDRAIMDYQPYAVCLLFSGGSDSLTALHVCQELGVKIDFIIHGVTGTGIQQTTDFVRKVAHQSGIKYLEANAGDAYTDYVLRKGFFGVGKNAHEFTYHLLKAGPFRRVVSRNIRHGKRHRTVLMINGARRLESENRKKTMIYPIRRDPSKSARENVWVNIINEWHNHSTTDFLEAKNIEQNPVSKMLCRSGECMCGSMQSMGDGVEAAACFPEWGTWWKGIRKAVKEKGFTWDWSEDMPRGLKLEKKGQLNMFQPMCTDCKIQYSQKEHSILPHDNKSTIPFLQSLERVEGNNTEVSFLNEMKNQ